MSNLLAPCFPISAAPGPQGGPQAGNNMIRIRVGAKLGDPVDFIINRSLFYPKAPFFDTMFQNGFLETTTQAASLPGDDPGVFTLFIHWLNTDTLQPQGGYADTLDDLVELYRFAEKYILDRFVDTIMEKIVTSLRASGDWILPSTIVHGYQVTHEKSRLRLLLAHSFIFMTFNLPPGYQNSEWSSAEMVKALGRHKDLLRDHYDLLRAGSAHGWRRNPIDEPLCNFHQHGLGRPCPWLLRRWRDSVT